MRLEEFEEVALQVCERIAIECHEAGKGWHFHILPPDCRLNPRRDRYAFVLENGHDDATYVAFESEMPAATGKRLVPLLHGDDVIDQNAAPGRIEAGFEEIVGRARARAGADESWHHHILSPGCIFNEGGGMWTLLLESPGDGGLLRAAAAEEPKEALRHLELLFYKIAD